MKNNYSALKKIIETLIYKNLIYSIKDTIASKDADFIIGDFPYWQTDCNIIKSSKRPYSYIHDAKCIVPGYVKAAIEFETKFQKKVLDRYGLVLSSVLHIRCRDGADHLSIEDEEDFNRLKDIEVPFLFINTDEEASRAQQFVDDFDELVFLHALEC
ncbi:hypothetical protein [Limnohabitans parvus]|uniref:Uncharacterized protein n=1 Tax=Limnohabitans parvus II-B4 TaxID=1293052 RepID=A0A315EDE5_9BURK|nr:hypothetical protein [Limnohabitans parvus]PUE55803.1 hypothetical protein B9Z37_04500 [Limnohabitans parvus II-B4]